MLDENTYNETDEIPLLRLIQGDRGAFAALYKRDHYGVYNFLLKFIKIPPTAEDPL